MLLMKSSIEIFKLDPNRIYIENVRALLRSNTFFAKLYCEMAVVDGMFTKHKALICPNDNCGRVICSYDFNAKITEIIECEICMDSEEANYKFKSKDLEKTVFYKLAR